MTNVSSLSQQKERSYSRIHCPSISFSRAARFPQFLPKIRALNKDIPLMYCPKLAFYSSAIPIKTLQVLFVFSFRIPPNSTGVFSIRKITPILVRINGAGVWRPSTWFLITMTPRELNPRMECVWPQKKEKQISLQTSVFHAGAMQKWDEVLLRSFKMRNWSNFHGFSFHCKYWVQF